MDSHTTVSYRRDPGYFERVGGSFCGIFVGFLLLLAAFPVLFFNEGRAVQTAQSLDEGLGVIVSLPSVDVVSDEHHNKLVHLQGKLSTDLALTDPDFGISIQCVKLRRNVEMYQWIEHTHKREYKEGDRTRVEKTYSYSREWKSEVVSSGGFSNPSGHHNPGSMPIKSYTKTADPVHVGQFRLSQSLRERVSDFRQFHPKQAPSHRSDLSILEHTFYRSDDPYRPQVGDIRITFHYAGVSGAENPSLGPQAEVSVIAKQNGEHLTSYQTQAGDVLEMLYHGLLSAKEIFESEHRTNTLLTWVLRFVGWIMMYIAFQIMMDIIRQIVSFLPIIRDIVGLATSIIAFTLSSSLALVTIAIGWFRYRPVLALSIIAAAAVPWYLSKRKAANEKSNESKKEEYHQ